ncbi:hypothetical protein DOY81_013583 [Sarcophaga bullata]|nr:hypothetical protein DOY81_013583 [Sarcophaga bullata]
MDDTLVYAQLGQLSINSSINPAQPSRAPLHYASQSAEIITNEADQSLSYCEAIVKCEDTMYIT